MAFLTKRGKYYYVKWNTSQDGKVRAVRNALGTRHKDVAQKMVTVKYTHLTAKRLKEKMDGLV